MIAFLKGRVAERGVGYLVVDLGAFGIKVFVPLGVAAGRALGSEVTLHTQLIFREDGPQLYGFPDAPSLELFRRLMGVQGVGPRSAMALISTLGPQELAQAIERGDTSAISKAPGVGQKIAARIVLELRGKLAGPPSAHRELVSALQELGFRRAEIETALRGWELPVDAPLEDLLAEALRRLGG